MTATTLTLTIARQAGREFVELPGAKLRLRTPSGQVLEAALGLPSVVVGSSPECDLVADDPSVSRTHCKIMATVAGVVIRDLGSKNGTLIRDVPIIEALLPPGAPVDGKPTRVALSASSRFGGALGASVSMRALFAELSRAAVTDEPVLLLGESGTGKGLLAQAIHDASPRRDGPFVVFDCAAVAPTLLESELFGYVKGAFTGATGPRTGLLEQGHGGTLFVDEIGELPLELQPRLLRALETGQVHPLGASGYRKVDLRVIAATHRDLRQRIAAGGFREDLYYRLAVVEAFVPPLRERKDDIPLLVESLLEAQQPPRNLKDLPPYALDLLQGHAWPGNVRELRNTVARLVLFPHLGSKALGLAGGAPGPFGAVADLPLREARDAVVGQFEVGYVSAKLLEHGGSIQNAAKAMGVSRQFLHRLMVRYDIRVKDDRERG